MFVSWAQTAWHCILGTPLECESSSTCAYSPLFRVAASRRTKLAVLYVATRKVKQRPGPEKLAFLPYVFRFCVTLLPCLAQTCMETGLCSGWHLLMVLSNAYGVSLISVAYAMCSSNHTKHVAIIPFVRPAAYIYAYTSSANTPSLRGFYLCL